MPLWRYRHLHPALIGLLVCATWAGCGPAVAIPDASDTTGASTSTSTTSTTSTTTATMGSETGEEESTSTGVGFIEMPDGFIPEFQCDLWTGEPCRAGFKCMPYANDGGSGWNASKCTPLDPDPAAPGEPCTVQGNGVSGIDDCEAFSMCFYVDPETNTGTCVSFCTGSEGNASCEDPCKTCSITGSGALILCLPRCDPLLQNCLPGDACYPLGDIFGCVRDVSGLMGTAGDACEYLNACDPGLFCANADAVEGCARSLGCCAPFCTVGTADPCPGLGPNTQCVPFYENPPPPSQCQSDNIGVCVVPG